MPNIDTNKVIIIQYKAKVVTYTLTPTQNLSSDIIKQSKNLIGLNMPNVT